MSIDATPGRAPPAAASRAPGRADVLTAVAVGAAVLLTSLVNFLDYNDYPLLRPEVGLVAILLVAVAAAMGGVYAAMGNLGRPLLQLVLVFLALDVNFGAVAAVVGTAAIGIVLRRHMMPFLGITSAVVLFSGLAGVGPGVESSQARQMPTAPTTSTAPALLHIILDEHIGVEGLLGDAPDVAAMREQLRNFYVSRGFHLSGGAYSEYLRTVYSIPQIFNFGIQQERSSPGLQGGELTTNAYFDRLGALGYGVHIWQVDYLGYCQSAAVLSCSKRRSSDAHDLVEAPLPVGEKFRLILNDMMKLSRLTRSVAMSYDFVGIAMRPLGVQLPLYRLHEHLMPSGIGALETFDRLAERLRHARPGEAYIMHELLPHYPYVMDADCRLKDAADWYNRRSAEVSKTVRLAAYFDQLSCTMQRVDMLLDALAASPAGANTIVIVHGDHGSRITEIDAKIETEGQFSDSDLIAGYSTLFAVRAPGMAAGYEARRQPAARLLEAFVSSGFKSDAVTLSPGFAPSVMLEDEDWEPVRRYPLPQWWVAGN